MSDPKQLTGLAAWEKVVGNSVTGMVEGRAFAEYYAKDGTVKFRIDGKTSVGRSIAKRPWRVPKSGENRSRGKCRPSGAARLAPTSGFPTRRRSFPR